MDSKQRLIFLVEGANDKPYIERYLRDNYPNYEEKFCRPQFEEHKKSATHVQKHIKDFEKCNCKIVIFVDTDDESKNKLHKETNEKFRKINQVPVVWFKKTMEEVFFGSITTSGSNKSKQARKFATSNDPKLYNKISHVNDVTYVNRGSNIKHVLDQILVQE